MGGSSGAAEQTDTAEQPDTDDGGDPRGDSGGLLASDRFERASTAFVAACGVALGAFAAVEVVAVRSGADRLAAGVALLASLGAALAGAVAVRSAGAVDVGTVQDGAAAALTGATVLLVVPPSSSLPFASGLLLTAVGLALFAVAAGVRDRIGAAV